MRKIVIFFKTFIITKTFLFALCALSVIFSFPFIVSLVSGMLVNLCKEESEKIYGRFDNIIYNVSYEDSLEEITDIDNVERYVEYYGTIDVYEMNGKFLFGAVDKNARELGNICVVKGTLPQKDTEVCLCESLYYELYADYEIGSIISIGNQNYKMVGLINDYSVAWNKPVKDTDYLCPNIIMGGSKHEENDRRILLLKNKTAFPTEAYKTKGNIVSNTNVVVGDSGAKYQAPDFIYITLYIVAFILFVYILCLMGERDRRNIEILNTLGISRMILKCFMVCKYICLSILSVLCGRFLGEICIYFFIKIFNQRSLSSVYYPNNVNNTNKVIVCLLLCIIAIFFVLTLKENKKTRGYKIDIITKLNIKDVLWLDLFRGYKGIFVSSVIMAIMLTSYLIMGLYLNMYMASKSDVFGKMPVDYDYQFTTNLNAEDYSYKDSSGEVVSVSSMPDEESVYYMPSHSNIISDVLINKMSNESGIYQVKSYTEANDIYLNLANKKENMEYLSGYPVDGIVDERVKEVVGLDKNSAYRNTQFCAFPKNELLNLEKYAIEGKIDYQKIDEGKEIILVVPVYEKIDYDDGSWGLSFIKYDEYAGLNNQYKDDTFHVGDEIELMQILPDDNEMMGYLNVTQIKKKTFSNIRHVRIGAIVYERVMWFEDTSQMTTAYSFIGTDKFLYSMGFKPTYTRTQLYLKDGINYRDFEPIIHKYQAILDGFEYENNAAEMEEYRQFMLFLKGICYLVILLITFIMIVIVFTETYTSFLGRREHYIMLRIIGMPPSVYAKIFLRRILVVYLVAVLLFLIMGLYMVNLIFGYIHVIWEYFGIKFIVYEMIFSLSLLAFITIIIYRPLLKKYVTDQEILV